MRTLLEYLFPRLIRRHYFSEIEKLSLSDLHTFKSVEPELYLLQYLVNSDSVVFDIGANIGEYTFQFQKLVSGGEIYAFEPQHTCSERLRRLFPEKHIHIVELAISDMEGETTLGYPVLNGKPLYSRASLMQNRDALESGKSETVETDSLDSFCEKRRINKIDLIKIDVEGAELKILKGAVKMIQRLKPVLIIEIEQRYHQDDIYTIFSMISDIGYEGFFYEASSRKVEPIRNFDLKSHQNAAEEKNINYINNFIFIPEESVEVIIQDLNHV